MAKAFANIPEFKLEAYAGTDNYYEVAVETEEGARVDLEEGTIKAHIKRFTGDRAIVAQFDARYDGEKQAIVLHLPYEESHKLFTAEIQLKERYRYDVVLEYNGMRAVLCYGELEVIEGVTD